jgi:hypothetical protein
MTTDLNRIDLVEVILPNQKPLSAIQTTETLIEGAAPQKFYYLDGLFLEGETENQNGRIYPSREIASAVAKLNTRISERGPIPGELDHPEGMSLNFDRLAVAITEMRMDGNNGVGRMRVVPEGLGKIVEGAIKVGIQVGVSSRGTGNVDSQGRVSDFDIVTVDAVLNPSAPNAYPTASLAESIAGYQQGLESMKLIDYAQYDPRAQHYLEKELENLFVAMRDEVVWR